MANYLVWTRIQSEEAKDSGVGGVRTNVHIFNKRLKVKYAITLVL